MYRLEFQLQQDELVDIYLVYSDSIFGLEPTTVRVREVGVGRGERRVRRERTATPSTTPSTEDGGLSAPAALHPADPTRSAETSATLGEPSSRSRSPSPQPQPQSFTPGGSDVPPAVPPRSRPTSSIPYSTFQQLDSFIPNLPSSILSSNWIIPPLYNDVVSEIHPAFAMPSTTTTGDHDLPPPRFDTHAPLLSPVSLLGALPHTVDGPPPLFFVTRGKHVTGIVTPDGRSCIKRPIIFNADTAGENTEEAYTRIEVLLVAGGTKTVIVGVGSTELRAVAVGSSNSSLGQGVFGEAVDVLTGRGGKQDGAGGGERDIQFLGKTGASQLFFSESVAGSHTIYCLSA